MKKLLFLILVTSCSMNFLTLAPTSTHVPSVNEDKVVFAKLEGTIWMRSRTTGDEYLFVDVDKYAIVSTKKGTVPDRYPQDYQWVYLSSPSDVAGLDAKVAVIYKENDSVDYMGFYLNSDSSLTTMKGNTVEAVSESLTSGTQWVLHI